MLNAMMRKGWLIGPSLAARESKKDRLDPTCLYIYLTATLCFTILFWWKPSDFPDRTAPIPDEMQNLSYWLKAELWQPVLEGGWVVFLLALLRFFRSGSWPVKLASAVALTAAPFILIGAYAQLHAFPYWGLAFGCAVWIAPFYFLTAGAKKADWWPLINFSLGINAIGLPIAALLALCVLIGKTDDYQVLKFAADAFKAVQIAGGLWILGATTLGVRELSGLRMPRVFMAVILSAFMQFGLAFCLHFLGAQGVLKALFYG